MIDPWALALEACELGAQQNPRELAQIIDLIKERQPKTLLEIGCAEGGTLYVWQQLAISNVYGITLPGGLPDRNNPPAGASVAPEDVYGANVHLGDSHAQASLEWVVWELGGRPVDVLYIDGDHTLAGIVADWGMYSPLVRPGGLAMVHDIRHPYPWFPELRQWWDDLGQGFVIEDDRPDYRVGFGIVEM